MKYRIDIDSVQAIDHDPASSSCLLSSLPSHWSRAFSRYTVLSTLEGKTRGVHQQELTTKRDNPEMHKQGINTLSINGRKPLLFYGLHFMLGHAR